MCSFMLICLMPMLLCDCQSFIKESYLLTYLEGNEFHNRSPKVCVTINQHTSPCRSSSQHMLTSLSWQSSASLSVDTGLSGSTKFNPVNQSINHSICIRCHNSSVEIMSQRCRSEPWDQSKVNRRVFRAQQNCSVKVALLTFGGRSRFHVVAAAMANAQSEVLFDVSSFTSKPAPDDHSWRVGE